MIADSFMEHHMTQLMVYSLAARTDAASPRATKATGRHRARLPRGRPLHADPWRQWG
jgi:hypothetical protein